MFSTFLRPLQALGGRPVKRFGLGQSSTIFLLQKCFNLNFLRFDSHLNYSGLKDGGHYQWDAPPGYTEKI